MVKYGWIYKLHISFIINVHNIVEEFKARVPLSLNIFFSLFGHDMSDCWLWLLV